MGWHRCIQYGALVAGRIPAGISKTAKFPGLETYVVILLPLLHPSFTSPKEYNIATEILKISQGHFSLKKMMCGEALWLRTCSFKCIHHTYSGTKGSCLKVSSTYNGMSDISVPSPHQHRLHADQVPAGNIRIKFYPHIFSDLIRKMDKLCILVPHVMNSVRDAERGLERVN